MHGSVLERLFGAVGICNAYRSLYSSSNFMRNTHCFSVEPRRSRSTVVSEKADLLQVRYGSSLLSKSGRRSPRTSRLSEFAAYGAPCDAAPNRLPDVDAFIKSLSTAWKDGEARPTHRKQPGAKHWWRTKVDPFADAWPLVDGWLIAEPSASAKELMDRLATMFPEAYAGNAQLRTLQRRVKAWRAERAKEMILGRLRKSTVMPAEV